MVRVDFDRGQPVSIEPFLTGFLEEEDGGYGFRARLSGLAVGPDGALYVGDDYNGVIYRVAHEPAGTQSASAVPDPILPPPPSEIAIAMVDAETDEALSPASAFGPNEPIPVAYSADGDNASPPVSWQGPEGAKSFVVIMDDPDAAAPKPFVHWIAYDIPGTVQSLREGLPTDPVLPEPKEMKQGTNSMGSTGYTGPKPPADDPAHHYHLQVFALGVESLGIDPGATRDAVLQAMEGKVLAKGEIVGTFER